MRRADFDDFAAMLDQVCGLLSRGTYEPSAANTAMFFRSLARHELADIRAAFDRHVADPQRGRFVPVPADIVAQLDGMAQDDGRPGEDEAWAIALPARDEFVSVVWTQEIAHAWTAARPVLDLGDEVGARMAFRQTYSRLVGEARASARPAEWTLAEGFDVDGRKRAMTTAVEQGRLPPPAAGPLLEGSPRDGEPNEAGRARLREQMRALQERMEARRAAAGIDAAERDRTAALQAEQQRRVVAYRERTAITDPDVLQMKPPAHAARGGDMRPPLPAGREGVA